MKTSIPIVRVLARLDGVAPAATPIHDPFMPPGTPLCRMFSRLATPLAVLGLGLGHCVPCAHAITYANWTFNDGSGADASANGHDLGGQNGPVIASPAGWGPSANCTSHGPGARDGFESWPNLSAQGLPTDNFTLGGYFKANHPAYANPNQSSVLATNGDGGDSLWIATSRVDVTTDQWVIRVGGPGGTLLANFPVTPDTAQHIEVTREAGKYSVWLDNAQVAGPTAAGGFSWNSFHVGVNSGGGTGYSGLFGDITVTDVASHAPEAKIKSFGLPGMPGTIDQTARTIGWPVTYVSDPASLAAEFTLSDGAIAYSTDPALPVPVEITSGTTVDFTAPVHYWVKSSDGLVITDYTVTVDHTPVSSAKDILTFSGVPGLPGVIGANTVDFDVPNGVPFSSLAPFYTVSTYFGGSATGSPESGTAPTPGFGTTNPATYTITAQDGTQKVYTVTAHELPPYVPPSLPPVTAGMVVWLPADGVNLVDANQIRVSGSDVFVRQWNDLSGNSQHAANADSGTQPQYLANDLNGLPSVKWDGTGKFLEGPTATTIRTVFAVCKKDAEASELDGMFCQSHNADSQNIRGDLNAWRASGTAQNTDGNDFPNNGQVHVNGNATNVHGAQWHVLMEVSASSPSFTYQLGQQAYNRFFNGRIAEILIYDRVLSGAEQNQVGYYLTNKYGISTAYYEPTATIASFGVPGHAGVIDQAAKTIALTVAHGTDLATVAPDFTLISGTCDQISGSVPSPSFAVANPVTYKVTEGATVNVYSVTVTVAPPAPGGVGGDLALWLDASASDTMTLDGATVNEWRDNFGGSASATLRGGSPTLMPSGIGGIPTIHFDTSAWMNDGVNHSSPVTILYVSRQTGGSNQRVLGACNNNWLMGYHGDQRNRFYFEGWVYGEGNGSGPDTNPHLYVATIGGGGQNSTVWAEGIQLDSNQNGQQGPNNLELNGYGNGGELSDCDISEVLIYHRILTGVELNAVGKYLTNKYGLNTAYDPSPFTMALTGDGTAGFSEYPDEADGYRFQTLDADLTVDWLGFYDAPNNDETGTVGDGLLASHRVSIWLESDGSLVAQTIVLTTDALEGNFRGNTITPVTLTANTGYVIAADYGGGDRMREGDNLTGWGVNWISGLAGRYGGAGGGMPIEGWGVMIGPNFGNTTAAASTYAGWAATNAPGQTPAEDYDHDGMPNGLEYFMGVPLNDFSFTANPGLDETHSVTWTMDPAFDGTYEVQTSPDLSEWTDRTADPAYVTNHADSVVCTLPEGMGRLFVRLVVTPN